MADHAFYQLLRRCSLLLLCLILSWCGGIILGCGLYEPSSLYLMRSAISMPVSIVGIFVSFFLPLLCTYFSVITNKPIIILVVCFLKATAFGYTIKLVSCYFLTAGWLIRLLFLFSDGCLLFFLLFLWIYHFFGNVKQSVCVLNFVGLMYAFVLLFDVYVIYPFIERLF